MSECSCEMVQQIVDEAVGELKTLISQLLTLTAEAQEGPRKKKKRAPSKYNLHIGKCMKEGQSMKECAVSYKKKQE